MLFSPLPLRSVTLRNRIAVSPMCQYSSVDGFAHDWHLVHLGSRASGGGALVTAEATAVEPHGRISPQDLGIWKHEHVESLKRITKFIRSQGAEAGIQIAHAGRKASTRRPWDKGNKVLSPEEGAWPVVAPSPIAFGPGYPVPNPLTEPEILEIIKAFEDAARRAHEAGFRVLEVHAAHGYLIHEFLSPLSNRRDDAYGGSLENRMRFPLLVVEAARKAWPEELPLFVRISATDWVEGGWTTDESVAFALSLRERGVDLVVCSSGGMTPDAKVALAPGYQVPFAERIRKEAGIPTGAVGMISTPEQAEQILAEGKADLVIMARELLRNPYWPLHVAMKCGQDENLWQPQYLRARP